MRGWSARRWAAAIAAAVLLLLGGAYAVFAFIAGGDAPPPVALSSPSASTGGSSTGATSSGDPAGAWTVDPGASFVGYRVREQLASLPAPSDAVGRTAAVTGSLQIDGPEISVVEVTADLTQLTSDESRRDDRIRSSGLETDAFPEATFTLTEPIVFETEPEDGETVEVTASGDLTLHGVTRSVEIPIQARRTGDTIEVVGSLEITFADYDIAAPSFGGFVTVQDHGTIELQLTFVPA
jgi:polyisoprenoid-binding protein YceI